MSSKSKRIPEGFHTLTPHIAVRDGHKAIDFYKKAFNAEVTRLVPGPEGKGIMHADLKIGDSILMLTDMAPVTVSPPPQGHCAPCTLHLYLEDVDATFKQAAAAGATVTMPLMDCFWGDRYGQLVDPFGHTWSLASHLPDMTAEQKQKLMQQMMQQGCGEAKPDAVAMA